VRHDSLAGRNRVWQTYVCRLIAVGRDETADITITLGTLGWRGQQGGELARGELRPEQEKILKSLRRHWTGLCVFMDPGCQNASGC
jgi:hypothetical protein